MNPMSYMNDLKNLPDQQLQRYLQMPNPPVPQFMVAAELQRRNGMRQSQKAQQPLPPSVRDQLAPQQPEGYAQGGLVAFAGGGLIPEYDDNGNIVGYSREAGGGSARPERLTPEQTAAAREAFFGPIKQTASNSWDAISGIADFTNPLKYLGKAGSAIADNYKNQQALRDAQPPKPSSLNYSPWFVKGRPELEAMQQASIAQQTAPRPMQQTVAQAAQPSMTPPVMGNRPPLPNDSASNVMPSGPLPIMRSSSMESSRAPSQTPLIVPSRPFTPPPVAGYPTRQLTDLPPELTQTPDELKALVNQNAAERNKGYEDIVAGRRQSLEKREGKLDEDKKQGALLALLQAGLGIMGGSSPYALQNIGTGGQKGVDALNKVLEEDKRSRADIEDKKFALNLAQYEAKLRNEGLAKSDVKDRVEQAKNAYVAKKSQADEVYGDALRQLDFGLKGREVAAKESDSAARNKSADANMMDALTNQKRLSLMASAGSGGAKFDPTVMEFVKEWSRIEPSVQAEAMRIAAKDPRVIAEDKFLRGSKDRPEYRAMLDKVAKEYVDTRRESLKTDFIKSISDLRGGMSPGIQTAESLLQRR